MADPVTLAMILSKLKGAFSTEGSPLPGKHTGKFGIDTRKLKKKKDDENNLLGGIQIGTNPNRGGGSSI